MNIVRLWWADSRGKVIALLLVLWAAAMINTPRIEFFFHVVLALTACNFLGMLILKIWYRPLILSPPSLIPGLLICFGGHLTTRFGILVRISGIAFFA